MPNLLHIIIVIALINWNRKHFLFHLCSRLAYISCFIRQRPKQLTIKTSLCKLSLHFVPVVHKDWQHEVCISERRPFWERKVNPFYIFY